MKKIFIYSILSVISVFSLWSQQPKDTLNTEIVNVVKPYKPSISDAFKLVNKPEVEPSSIQKIPIDYSIESAPVASTFTPSKGKAKKVSRAKKERLYDNYISLGFGNYTTPLLEAYVRSFPDRYSEFGAFVKHHSSQGGIDGVHYDNSFYNTDLDVYYKQSTRDVDWKTNFDIAHVVHHWYGVEKNRFATDFLDAYNPKQSYLNLGVGGSVSFYDSFFKEAQAKVYFLSDNYKSSEFRLKIQPELEFDLASEIVKLGFDIDYLKGSFVNDYERLTNIEYTHINLGIAPSFVVLRDDLDISLGAKIYANTDDGNPIQVYAYPNVNASYQLVPDVLTVFAGATGGMNLNTYKEALSYNPFMSPTFYSKSTHQKYKAFGGIKGKLASNIGYLFKASYADEENKALYVVNHVKMTGIIYDIEKAYELGNSFSVLYDDVQTLGIHGEINIDFTKEFSFGGNINFDTYNLKKEAYAWNLPNMKATLFADYHTGKWRGTSKVFVVGKRYDRLPLPSLPLKLSSEEDSLVNEAYVDLNLGVSYSFNNQLSAFIKGHNLLGTQYQRFYQYPTQGIQVMGGITYKFDLQ